MKTTFWLAFAAAVLLSGCNEKSGSAPAQTNTTSTSSGNPVTAVPDYLGALGKAQQSAVKTIDLSVLNNAVNTFYVAEDRYPKDLNELIPQYIRELPKPPIGYKLDYNPQTGKVTVQKN